MAADRRADFISFLPVKLYEEDDRDVLLLIVTTKRKGWDACMETFLDQVYANVYIPHSHIYNVSKDDMY